ncbi:D-serine ammonia-lyase [Lentisphaerota bacterium ZTH]|nr:D-serine ammonia-lyase [Lentisphaerota bacterium]WET06477.1 D-serine ammonia-lyase [Lentisphaerota bacterium ZTH]
MNAVAERSLNVNDLISQLKARLPVLWVNNSKRAAAEALKSIKYTFDDILDAQARLYRFAPLLAELFGELGSTGGLIESDLQPVPGLRDYLWDRHGVAFDGGTVLVKADHSLPVAGSVKARGGIYEVLKFAEMLALHNNLLCCSDNYIRLSRPECREFFSSYTVSVGSTGNLGLSIGIIAAALGFRTQVHMSFEAKEWKKHRLRQHGVTVIEHETDYTSAVTAARVNAEEDPFNYFVDDENSIDLFLGYAVAAIRLKHQLRELGIKVNAGNPLFVYLPCGIGGAPGGITFGLKHVFGDAVHCFFAEPVGSPSMLLGLATGRHAAVSVYDIGLDNRTEADGLAVSAPSGFVGEMLQPLLSGAYTFPEADMFEYLYAASEIEGLKLEPSATAAFAGPAWLLTSEAGISYLEKNRLSGGETKITHILWTTGGSFVPDDEFSEFMRRGAKGGLH